MLLNLTACDSPTNASRITPQSKVGKKKPISVKTISLKLDESPLFVHRYSGLVKPVRTSELSFTQAGKVANVFVDVGSTVQQGQILARLDDEQFKKQKSTLESQLKVAQTELNSINQQNSDQSNQQLEAKINQLRSDLNRIEIDLKNSVPSTDTQDNLNRRLQKNEAQIQTLNQKSRQQKISGLTTQVNDLQRQIQEADAMISARQVSAPFTGVVIEKLIEPGSVVSPGRPVLKIAKMDAYRIWVKLPEDLAASLKLGQTVQLEKDQQKISGKVTSIHPKIDPLTQTRMVVIEPGELKATDVFTMGERVDVFFSTPKGESGFWLPVSALLKEIDGLWSVYLVETKDKKTTIVRRYVNVIDVADDRALVSGNLREGMFVVTEGLHRIVPGQVVRLASRKVTGTKSNKKPEQVPGL